VAQHTDIELLKAPGLLDLAAALQVILFPGECDTYLSVVQRASVFRRQWAFVEAITLVDTIHVDIGRESGRNVALAIQLDLER
jgi:hypothetical protein